MGGKKPKVPEPPPPPAAPPPMPVPDDVQTKTDEKKRAARRIQTSGRQSTLLSERDPLGGA